VDQKQFTELFGVLTITFFIAQTKISIFSQQLQAKRQLIGKPMMELFFAVIGLQLII